MSIDSIKESDLDVAVSSNDNDDLCTVEITHIPTQIKSTAADIMISKAHEKALDALKKNLRF